MQSKRSAGCLIGPAAITVYGLLGFLILWQFGGQALNYVNSSRWQQVSGTVVSSNVVDVSDTSGERYTGRVVYTYEVDGDIYENDQLDLRGDVYVGNRDDAEQLIAPYPAGASVMPYVAPDDPTRAVLARDVQGAVWWLTGFGGLLVLLSLGLVMRFIISSQSPQETTA